MKTSGENDPNNKNGISLVRINSAEQMWELPKSSTSLSWFEPHQVQQLPSYFIPLLKRHTKVLTFFLFAPPRFWHLHIVTFFTKIYGENLWTHRCLYCVFDKSFPYDANKQSGLSHTSPCQHSEKLIIKGKRMKKAGLIFSLI